MPRDLNALFNYEVKRRPKLAAMLETDFSLNDVENSGFPKWIRQALVGKINQKKQAQMQADLTIANADLISDGFMPDPLGTLRRWNGGTFFVALDRGHLQVETGNLIWLPFSGGVWFETIFSKKIDSSVFNSTTEIAIKSKREYIIAYKSLLASKTMPDVPVIGDNRQSPLAAYGIRFY